MKKKFRVFCRPTKEEFKTLWENAVFVFDTNVLLNMYEYPDTVYNTFLQVMKSIKSRIWIPYHVGLEFHRNKIQRIKKSNDSLNGLLNSVMGASSKLESDLRKIELEKRNLDVDIEDKITAVRIAYEELSSVVKLACNKLPAVSLDDRICTEIFNIVGDSIGSPVRDQNELNKLLEDAEDRYASKIPPGFSEKKDDVIYHRGLVYHNKHGDLMIWRQMFHYINDAKIKYLIFVTDDNKDDWWWIKGGKTLGPLPELVEEIYDNTSLEGFWMYSSGQLLEYSKQYIESGVEVSQETIDRIKDLSLTDQNAEVDDFSDSMHLALQPRIMPDNSKLNIFASDKGLLFKNNSIGEREYVKFINENKGISRSVFSETEQAVESWIVTNRTPDDSFAIESGSYPDIIVECDGLRSGFEIIMLRYKSIRAVSELIEHEFLRGQNAINSSLIDEFTLIVVFSLNIYRSNLKYIWSDEITTLSLKLLSKYSVKEIIYGVVRDGNFKMIYNFENYSK